jgi:lysophospholipase L1-like esterase
MRVLVLGDSCSAGIGAAQAVYPAVLHRSLGSAHRIENHAVPGLTSADAARYYRRAMVRHRWDFVIVYLGNTDASRSVYKGTYRRWRDMPGWSAQRRTGQIVPIERRESLVFNDRAEQLSVATTPQDFRRNLESIVRTARRHGTRVILINPIANGRFPASLMGSNAAFYKLVGLNARLADRLTGIGTPAQALVRAIADHERGELATAAERYRLLAKDDSRVRPLPRRVVWQMHALPRRNLLAHRNPAPPRTRPWQPERHRPAARCVR